MPVTSELPFTSEIPLESIKHRYLELVSSDLSKKTVLISHFGDLSGVKIESLLKITEETILETGSKRQIMRSICSLLIEALQNIANHSAKDQNGKANSFVIIEHCDFNFTIKTGNLISANEIITLEQKLNTINRLNQNELKKRYIETLCNDNFNQKGGAGLGFLTMAKKIDGFLDYQILNVTKNLAYFTLSLSIPHQN
tara:strand:- start:3133 stop:3726 length:594 start_codon:yes stop_codon:yes gene_type:complete